MKQMITSTELREKYIEFFKSKGHKEIPSASLVPENDPTVLFTTAGMHPLVPYLLGEFHPEGKRLVNVQKCVRTGDIDDVGDSTHNTFFEMLGNWSLGDYFKNDSIRWSFEFLTDKKWLGIDPQKIKVTVFEGDENAPRDDESIKIWRECFENKDINVEVYDKEKKNNETARIFPLPKGDNWWGPAGQTGPCGPDTEIFIDLEKSVNFENCPNGEDCKPGCHCGRYVEIWNNVFMEYNKTTEGKYIPLTQKNVDTGMGMERTLAILNGFDTVYETDVLKPIVEKIKTLVCCLCENEVRSNPMSSHKEPDDGIATLRSAPLAMTVEEVKSIKIISDHIRTSVFMISDGVVPSNLDRGYILRRLLRRAIRYGNLLKLPNGFLSPLAETVIEIYKEFYPELEKNEDVILEEIKKEEDKFGRTIKQGAKELTKCTFEKITGKYLFYIFSTFGFPLELSFEEIENVIIPELKLNSKKELENKEEIIKEFNEELKKHQELSRTASAGKFKGGLADASEETTRLHTAAHLLLESLRRVLGEHIFQKGSNITAERLRFDYSHPNKLTDEEKQKVEYLVNEQIQKSLPINYKEMSLEEAKKINAMGVFESKYGEKVKVYTIGKDDDIFSREICGGPHVKNTSELVKFKIKKEQSSSAGVRRIKAVLE
ncbi:MAG: alanine--tRNA ligase-related protein [Patescibacteria group bacterium]|nr:alanine--tRNA ligase-related protein [Patescibacteria group bacterium]